MQAAVNSQEKLAIRNMVHS